MTAMEIFKNDWGRYLDQELAETYYIKLREFLIHEYQTQRIYPSMYDIFNALHKLLDTRRSQCMHQ